MKEEGFLECGILYNDVQMMSSFGLSPEEFDNLHRWDKKALYYFLIMKNYFEVESYEKMKRKSEREREFKGKLPKLDFNARRK